MTETEMLKELRIIVAKVAHVDQASGRAPAHVLQAKEKVRESWCQWRRDIGPLGRRDRVPPT